MSAYIISVLGIKGGSGKTTVSVNAARGLERSGEGDNVLIIDSDSQGTATAWSLRETDYEFPEVIYIPPKKMASAIEKINSVFDFIIIDGKGNLEANHISPIIKASDLIIIPCRASGFDLWANAPLVELIKARQDVTDGQPQACFMITQIKPGTNIAFDVQDELDKMGLPTLKSVTRDLVPYQEATTKGLTVYEWKKAENAKSDIEGLVREVLEIVNGKILEVPVIESDDE